MAATRKVFLVVAGILLAVNVFIVSEHVQREASSSSSTYHAAARRFAVVMNHNLSVASLSPSPSPLSVSVSSVSPPPFSLTIYTCPKAFNGDAVDRNQRLAILSWLSLYPKPRVVLACNDSGIREVAAEYGVEYLPEVERSPRGTPVLSDLMAKAAALSHTSHLCYVNSDILLEQSFMRAIHIAVDRFKPRQDLGGEPYDGYPGFLITGQRTHLELGNEVDTTALQLPQGKAGKQVQHLLQSVFEMGKTRGNLTGANAQDYFVYNKNYWEQISTSIPPFRLGRMVWDNWLTQAAALSPLPAIDASAFVVALHLNHSYQHMQSNATHFDWKDDEVLENQQLAVDTPYQEAGLTDVLPFVFANRQQLQGKMQRVDLRGYVRSMDRDFPFPPLSKMLPPSDDHPPAEGSDAHEVEQFVITFTPLRRFAHSASLTFLREHFRSNFFHEWSPSESLHEVGGWRAS